MEVKKLIQFKSSYSGEANYEIYDETYSGAQISYRFASGGDYFKGIYNGSPEEYTRDVEGKMFLVSRFCGKITEDIFQKFYAHLQKEWEELLAYCADKKKEFGNNPGIRKAYEHYGPACPLVYPAYWDKGWHQLDYKRI
jgi:hypothetical protein